LETLPQVFLMLQSFEGVGGELWDTDANTRTACLGPNDPLAIYRPYFSCTGYVVSNTTRKGFGRKRSWPILR
jgi:hypothetical protein